MGIKSVLAFLALGLAAMASAQTANYPIRPVTVIVPAGAGRGGTDVVARAGR